MILYHGSPIQGLKNLNHNNLNRYNKNDDTKYIYLTSDINFAACYGIRWDDSTFRQGYVNDDLYFASTSNIPINKLPDTSFSIYEVDIPDNKIIKIGKNKYVCKSSSIPVKNEYKYKSFRDVFINEIFDINYVSIDKYYKISMIKENRMDNTEKINSIYNRYVDGEITREEYELMNSVFKRLPIMESYLNDECDYTTYLYNYFKEDATANIMDDARSNSKIYLDNFKKNHKEIKRRLSAIGKYIKAGENDEASKMINETTIIVTNMIKEVQAIPNNEFIFIARNLIDICNITTNLIGNETGETIFKSLSNVVKGLDGVVDKDTLKAINLPYSSFKKIGKAIDISFSAMSIYSMIDKAKRMKNDGDVGSVKMFIISSMKKSIVALKKYKVIIAKSMNDIDKLKLAKKELKHAKRDKKYYSNRIISG